MSTLCSAVLSQTETELVTAITFHITIYCTPFVRILFVSDVTLKNIDETDRIRIVLTYPGGTDQVVSPSQDKFSKCEKEPDAQLPSSSQSKRIHNDYKLSTTCFISHASWTDPGDLSIGVYLAVPKLFDETLSLDSPEKLVSISSKVKIVIHPKPNAL